GVLPPQHPLNVGVLLPFEGAHAVIKKADVVLALGTEFSETDVLYSGRAIEIDGALIRVDIDPTALHVPFAAEVAIC
ncbi:hypothetical protein ACC848_45470, partial [Rhizobium johnstonii]